MTAETHLKLATGDLDTYFTSAYGRAAAHGQHGTFLNYVSPDGLVHIPLIIKQFDDGVVDAESPYGYAGLRYTTDNRDVPDWAAITDDLASRGIVSVFLRQHPFVPSPPPPATAQRTINDHPTYCINSASEQDAWDSFSVRARRSIRKALKAELTVDIHAAKDTELRDGAPFRRIYEEAMQRVQAHDFYYFDDTYYRLLLDGLGENLLIANAVSAEGKTVASVLLMQGPEHLHYHLSGATEEGLESRATALIIWEATRYFTSAGLRGGLYLGGGFPVGGGLDEFKRSFGRTPIPYNAYGIILDSHKYEDAVTRRRGVGPIHDENFFPLYRAELPAHD